MASGALRHRRVARDMGTARVQNTAPNVDKLRHGERSPEGSAFYEKRQQDAAD